MNTRVHCWIYTGAIVITAFLVLFFHVWKIASIPNGLYQDETAIGYNASLIADTGFDEHQHFLPVYFESFSDYKAPIYIYAVAGFFKLFDPSIFLLRFTSVFFFLLTLIGCVCVVSMLTEKPDRRVLLYTLLAVGFLPWFFTLSRISFEVISQTTFTVWSLWFLQKIYTDPRDRFASIMAAVGGILMGITLYTYPTARVLTPLFVLFTLCIFARRSSWKRTLTMLGGFVIAMIPYAVYSLQNPGAMTSRFKGITYVFDPTASLLQKIHTFVGAVFFSEFSSDSRRCQYASCHGSRRRNQFGSFAARPDRNNLVHSGSHTMEAAHVSSSVSLHCYCTICRGPYQRWNTAFIAQHSAGSLRRALVLYRVSQTHYSSHVFSAVYPDNQYVPFADWGIDALSSKLFHHVCSAQWFCI
jgi:hypothetical protein